MMKVTEVKQADPFEGAVNVMKTFRLLGGIGRSTLIRLTAAGKLRMVKVGNRNMYLLSDIKDFLGA